MNTTTTLPFKTSKYNIANLLRQQYGELGIKQGKKELMNYCQITNVRTIDNWLSIECGNEKSIHPFLIDKVLSFFNLQDECQLYTNTHKELLKLK